MKYILLLISCELVCCFIACPVRAQDDTSGTVMTVDFGITRIKNINLWPIFKLTREKEDKDLQVLAPLFRNHHDLANGRKHSRLLPFYLRDSSATERHLRLISLQYPSLIHHSTNVQTGVSSFKFLELVPNVSFFEYSKVADGTFIKNSLFFFLWSKYDDVSKESHFIAFPIYWSFSGPVKQSTTIFPFYSKGSNTEHNSKYLTVTPLFWSFTKGDQRKNYLFPLWWDKRTIGGGLGGRRSSVLFPLYWAKQDREKSSRILFPLIWQFKNGSYQSLTVPPLFSYGSSPDNTRKHLMVTPLFWHRRKSDDFSNVLFPFWWDFSEGTGKETKRTKVLFPFYWSYLDKDNSSKVIFPFIWDLRSENYSSLTIAPFFSEGSSPDGTKTHLMLTPFYWAFSDKDVQSTYIYPFYWSFKNKEKNNKVLFPIIWSFENKNYSSLTVLPLYSGGRSEDGSRSHLAITPFYWAFANEDKQRNILFPIWWRKKSGEGKDKKVSNLLLPLYYSHRDKDKSNSVAFPLVWNLKNEKYASLTVPPLFSKGISADGTKKHLTVTPLYWAFANKDKQRNILFPIWWRKKSGEGEDKKVSNLLLPLFYSYRDKEKQYRIIFPLAWSLRSDKYKSLSIPPLFSFGFSADSSQKHLAITPLFWKFSDRDNRKNVLFPFWWNFKQGSGDSARRTNILFPFYWSVQDEEKNNKVLFPLVWKHQNEQYQSLTVPPLFSRGTSADGTRKHLAVTPLYWAFANKDKQRNILFPLWWRKKVGTGENRRVSNLVLPLYYSYRYKKKSHSVVFPLVWKLKNERYRSLTVAPLFSKGTSADSTRKHLAITPFYWALANKDTQRNIFFPLWWRRETGTGEDKEVSNLLLPLYYTYYDKETSNKVVFPLIWKLKNERYKSLTVAPLFSKGESADGTRKHFVFTPLYWQFSDHDKKSNVVLPLWWHFKSGVGEDSRISSVLFPLYFSFKDKERTSKVFFPLVWKFKNEKYRSLTVPPLYSKGESADGTKKHLMLSPLYWQFANKDRRSNTLFPLWWHFKSGNGEHIKRNNVVFPLYWASRDQEKNNKLLFPLVWSFSNKKYRSLTIPPLFSVGHSPDGEKKHLAITPLFWRTQKSAMRSTVLVPIFKYSSDNDRNESSFNILYFLYRYKQRDDVKQVSFLWPLGISRKATDEKYWQFAPFLWRYKSEDHRYFAFQPFYYHNKNTEFESHRFLWELFVHKNYANGKRSRSFLWRSLIINRYDNNDHELRLFWLLYANINKEGNTLHSIFPLYHRTGERNGNKSLSLFFHFYNSHKKKIEGTDEYYQEKRIFWFIRFLSNYKHLEKKGIRVT